MATLQDVVDDIMRRVDASPEQVFLRETLRRRLAERPASVRPATTTREAVTETILRSTAPGKMADGSTAIVLIERKRVLADAILAEHIAPRDERIAALTAEQEAARAKVQDLSRDIMAACRQVQEHFDAAQDAKYALTAAKAEIEGLRAGIQAYLDGDYPNPRQHRPGKCPHGVFFYDECPSCDEAHFTALLARKPARAALTSEHDHAR